MLEVLDAILNKSYQQLGFPNGVGKTYEAILTVKSIPQAQAYYNLLKSIKAGQERVKVSERAKRVLLDFPKMTVTYSVSENEEESIDYQDHMKQVMDDYNQEFGTHFNMADLRGFNTDINNRLARKLDKYIPRNEQLDLVIVVDRLLTGFDAPCLSTLFIDRKPMRPQDLIQAFSRTNRIFDSKSVMVISSPSKDQRPLKRLWITPLNSTQTEVKMTSLPQIGTKKKPTSSKPG